MTSSHSCHDAKIQCWALCFPKPQLRNIIARLLPSAGCMARGGTLMLLCCSAADLANIAAAFPTETLGDVLLANGAKLVAHACVRRLPCVPHADKVSSAGSNLFEEEYRRPLKRSRKEHGTLKLSKIGGFSV